MSIETQILNLGLDELCEASRVIDDLDPGYTANLAHEYPIFRSVNYAIANDPRILPPGIEPVMACVQILLETAAIHDAS